MEKSRRKLIMVLLVAIFAILTAVAIVTLAFAATQQQINTTLTIGYVAEDLDGSVYATYKIGNRETKYLIPTGADSDHINNNSLLFKATDKGNAGTLEFPETDRDISLTANEDLIIQYTYSNTGSKHYIASMSFDNALTYKNMTVEYSKDGETYSDERYAVVVPAESSDCSYWIKISIDDKSKNASLSGNFNWNLKGCDKSSKEYVSLTSMEFKGNAGSYSASVTSAGSGHDGKIVFPSSINGDPVTTISQSTLTQEEKNLITQVVIPNSVTKIGQSAFQNFRNLTDIEIPDSVESLAGYAFYDCISLETVKIGKGLSSIGSWAFARTSSLTSIIVDPVNQTYYSSDDNGDYNCIIEKSEKKLVVGCQTTNIPNGVEVIGNTAFVLCTTLTSITIPASVTTIEENNPFGGCMNLISMTVDSDNTNYYMENNCLMENSTKRLVTGLNLSNTTIPTDTKSIGVYAFYCCGKLTSVDVPTGVTRIYSGAFQNCTSLSSVTLPNTLTAIESSAFNSTIMKTITIPASVTYIANNPFVANRQLENIIVEEGNTRFSFENGCLIDNQENTLVSATKSFTTIPDSVTTIKNYAFAYQSLTSITIPSHIKQIGMSAFSNCSSLDSVTFENTSGWFLADSFSATSGRNLSSTDLSDSKTAARYLTSVYLSYWICS